MKLKQIPEDFIVNEVFDIKPYLSDSKEYYYFKLKKINYSQLKAIETVARIFKKSSKQIHFSGTKDKVGITTQIISINFSNLNTLENNINFFNERINDLELELLGHGNERINLGSHNGNEFIITIRDLSDKEIETAKDNIKIIEKDGVKNYFDSQRFGFANNSDIVGELVIQNKIEEAVKEILLSLPENPAENHLEFNNYIKNNWNEIKNANSQVIGTAIKLAPRFLYGEVEILNHLKKFKNDFPGAFRNLHKKLRTLYLNAYQAKIFNNYLDKHSIDELKNKEIQLEEIHLTHMPELSIDEVPKRKAIVYPNNVKIIEEGVDELNNKKLIKISFTLENGAYATNIIKFLFQ